VLLNTTLEVGVWGSLYGPDWTVEYKVEPDAGSVALVSVAKTQQGGKEKPITGNIRSWSVTGNKTGPAVLNVKTREGWLAAPPLKVDVTDTLIAWGSKVSPDFKQKVIEICKRLTMDPSDLMACMYSETAGTLDPHKWNGDIAVGLIQFTAARAQREQTLRNCPQ
jgi:hypothetical protein